MLLGTDSSHYQLLDLFGRKYGHTNHFEEDALRGGDCGGESRLHGLDVSWDDAADDRRGADAGDDLGREEDQASDGRYAAGDDQAESDCWVENTRKETRCQLALLDTVRPRSALPLSSYRNSDSPSRNPVHSPSRNQQRKPIAQTNVDNRRSRVRAVRSCVTSLIDSHQVSEESQHEEHKGAHELAGRGDKMFPNGRGRGRVLELEVAAEGLVERVVLFHVDVYLCLAAHIGCWPGGFSFWVGVDICMGWS